MQIDLDERFVKVSLKFYEALDTPRAHSCALLLKSGEFGQLVNLTVDPRSYEDPDAYYRDAVATDWLRKCAGLPTGIDTPAVAEQDFLSCELDNARTNARLAPFLYGGPFQGPQDERIGGFLRSVKKVIRDILGPLPQDLHPRFGPGSTFEDRGQLTTLPDKMTSRPTITRNARCFIDLWNKTLWSRAIDECYPKSGDPKTVNGNRFTTVSKDATKDRGIAIEPSINVCYQLAVGRHIRGALKRIGIDLKRGQSLHRQVACAASLRPLWSWLGEVSTIDLKSASDSVTRVLVKLLFPEEWLTLLESLRSPRTLFKGKWHYLEKFSSMGNGFTFELETLIFLAISLVVCGRDGHPGRSVHVYGDDIIVPTKHASSLISVLRYLGFRANPRKTFTDSHFRESCGGDFFKGQPVRAHFVKNLPTEPQHWIAIANGLQRVIHNFKVMGSTVDLKKVWFSALDAIPSHIRSLRGPAGLADLVVGQNGKLREKERSDPAGLGDLVIADLDESKWKVRYRSGIRYVQVYRPVGRSLPLDHWKPAVLLSYAVYGGSSRGVSPRDNISGYKIGWVPFS